MRCLPKAWIGGGGPLPEACRSTAQRFRRAIDGGCASRRTAAPTTALGGLRHQRVRRTDICSCPPAVAQGRPARDHGAVERWVRRSQDFPDDKGVPGTAAAPPLRCRWQGRHQCACQGQGLCGRSQARTDRDLRFQGRSSKKAATCTCRGSSASTRPGRSSGTPTITPSPKSTQSATGRLASAQVVLRRGQEALLLRRPDGGNTPFRHDPFTLAHRRLKGTPFKDVARVPLRPSVSSVATRLGPASSARQFLLRHRQSRTEEPQGGRYR